MSITDGVVAKSPANVSDPSPPDSKSGRSFAVDIIANCIDLTWRKNVTRQKIIYKYISRLYWSKDSVHAYSLNL